jgi:hypothetical protein
MRPLTHRRLMAVAIAVTLAGCGPDIPSATPPQPSASISASTASPEHSPAPTSTAIPGFADWQLINPPAVALSVNRGALVIELTQPTLWLDDQSGVLFYREVTGDFRATATVRTSKPSDPSAPPGQDGTAQLAGLMARAGGGQVESYVSIGSGSIGSSTGLETNTTESSHSIDIQRGLPTGGDAELQLCRKGSTFYLWWRHVDSSEDWTHMSTLDRKDLPGTLEVGASVSADGPPDIVARFEALTIKALTATEAC